MLDYFNISIAEDCCRPRDGYDWLEHVYAGGDHIRAYIKMRLIDAGVLKFNHRTPNDIGDGKFAEEYLESEEFRVFCKFWDWNSNFFKSTLFGATIEELKEYNRLFSCGGKVGRDHGGEHGKI